jgi:plasmid stabilization system protein ParE
MIGLILLLQADLDIQSAFARYENYQSGRGEVFMRHLDAALTLLREHPEIAPIYAGPYRRMLIRDFPYGVFYQVQANRIIVTAILNLKQSPQSIQQKLIRPESGEKP